MTASRKQTRKRKCPLPLLLALTITPLALQIASTQCLAKTRPPIEAGDPDIGNEKPRGASQATTRLIDSQTTISSGQIATNDKWSYLRTLLFYSYRALPFLWY
jgi:hypothetical protein